MYQYLPDLLCVQRESYFNFLQEGLLKEIKSGLKSVQRCSNTRLLNSERIHLPFTHSPIPTTCTSFTYVNRTTERSKQKYTNFNRYLIQYTPRSNVLAYTRYNCAYSKTDTPGLNVNTTQEHNGTQVEKKAKIKLKKPTYSPDEALNYSRTYATEVYIPVSFAAFNNIYQNTTDVSQTAYGKASSVSQGNFVTNTDSAFGYAEGISKHEYQSYAERNADNTVQSVTNKKGKNAHTKVYQAAQKSLMQYPGSRSSYALRSKHTDTDTPTKNEINNYCTWTPLSWIFNEDTLRSATRSYKNEHSPNGNISVVSKYLQRLDSNLHSRVACYDCNLPFNSEMKQWHGWSSSYPDQATQECKYVKHSVQEDMHTYTHGFKNALGKDLLSTSLHSETCKKIAYISVGNFPLLTNEGSFVINGARRMIMNQIVRSPGIYYKMQFRSRNHRTYTISYVSDRGVWLRIERDKSDYIWIRINNYQKIPLFVFLRSLGITDEVLLNTLSGYGGIQGTNAEYDSRNYTAKSVAYYAGNDTQSLWKSLKIGNPSNRKRALQYLGWVFRKGKKPLSVKQTREFLNEKLFHPRYYSFTKAGRLSINKKFNNVFQLSTLSPEDILLGLLALFKLELGETSVDDIDHLKNKRVRLVHELLQNQIRRGFKRLEEESLKSNTHVTTSQVAQHYASSSKQDTPGLQRNQATREFRYAESYGRLKSSGTKDVTCASTSSAIPSTWYYKKGYEFSDTFVKPNFSTLYLHTHLHPDACKQYELQREITGYHNGLPPLAISSASAYASRSIKKNFNRKDTLEQADVHTPALKVLSGSQRGRSVTNLRTLHPTCTLLCSVPMQRYPGDYAYAFAHHSDLGGTAPLKRLKALGRYDIQDSIIEKARNLCNGKILCISGSNYTLYASGTKTSLSPDYYVKRRLFASSNAIRQRTHTHKQLHGIESKKQLQYGVNYNVHTHRKCTKKEYYIAKRKALNDACIYLRLHENAYALRSNKYKLPVEQDTRKCNANENVNLCEPIGHVSANKSQRSANFSTSTQEAYDPPMINSGSFTIKIKQKEEFLKYKFGSKVCIPVSASVNLPTYALHTPTPSCSVQSGTDKSECTEGHADFLNSYIRLHESVTSFSFLHSSFCVPLISNSNACNTLNDDVRSKRISPVPVTQLRKTKVSRLTMQLHGSKYLKVPTVKNKQVQRLIQKADCIDYDSPKNHEEIHAYFMRFEKPVSNTLKEFFGLNPLSQFMDQINPLGELTQKRRLTSLGPGGVTREAGLAVRDIHPSYYGRICPIETPEGKNAGLVNSLSSHSRINTFGFIETGYIASTAFSQRYVSRSRHTSSIPEVNASNEKWDKMRQFTWLSSKEEEKYYVVPIHTEKKRERNFSQFASGSYQHEHTAQLHTYTNLSAQSVDGNENNTQFTVTHAPDDRITCRYNQSVLNVPPCYIDFSSVSSISIISIATSLIPFLEHDDGNRALMGCNMQRQGVPLLHPEKAIVGTGIESQIARDSRTTIVSKSSGIVNYADSRTIEICHKSYTQYTLPVFQRTNQNTLLSANPIVYSGDYVRRGEVIADTCSTKGGELSIGKNLYLGYMPWEGYNFEDAIVINQRVVYDHSLTSVHVEKIKVSTDTDEEFFPPKPSSVQAPMLADTFTPFKPVNAYERRIHNSMAIDTAPIPPCTSIPPYTTEYAKRTPLPEGKVEHRLNRMLNSGTFTYHDSTTTKGKGWLELNSLYLLYKYQNIGYYKETVTLA